MNRSSKTCCQRRELPYSGGLTVAYQDLAATVVSPNDLPTVVEKKYGIWAPVTQRFVDALSSFTKRDPSFPASIVNTIYFDTPDLSSYRESRHGFDNRTKVRLRWYGDIGEVETDNQVSCYLEIKARDGGVRSKKRIEIGVPAINLRSNPLNNIVIRKIGQLAAGLAPNIPRLLLPSLLIDYHRDRFIDRKSNTRMAIDRDISCFAHSGVILPTRLILMRNAIFETKGGTIELPPSIKFLDKYLNRLSMGKYTYFCRQILGSPFTAAIDE